MRSNGSETVANTRTRQHCNYRIKFFATAILIEHKLFLYLSRLFRTNVFPPVPYHLLLGILIAGKRESLRSQFRRGMLVLYGGKFQRIRLRRVSGFEIFTSTLNRAKRGEVSRNGDCATCEFTCGTKFHDNDVINFYNRHKLLRLPLNFYLICILFNIFCMQICPVNYW